MMEVRTQTTYVLSPENAPTVTPHDDTVSLHHSALMARTPAGFTVILCPEHIPQVEKLLEALRNVQARRDQPVAPHDGAILEAST